ncbi:MAG: L-histidine N(alpha)-methyltransferase [Acidimicrobiales bacterium]
MNRQPEIAVDIHLTVDDLRRKLGDDVRQGMAGKPKSIPPVWFYDEVGSRLFEEITRLPEYYPTRVERSLLERHGSEIAEIVAADTLVELGAGACDKTRLLLDAMTGHGQLRRYVPFDVSDEFLRAAAGDLQAEYADLDVHVVVGDFCQHLDRIPMGGRRLVAFLGGTIGNFLPDERRRFLFDLNCTMAFDDHLLLGSDLVKDPDLIVNAYDDAGGVTAEFNRNVLRVLNHQLGAAFEPREFDHVARWDQGNHWIEMLLRSRCRQTVTIGDLDMEVDFDEGEEMLTEISAKFTPDQVRRELADAGFVVDAMWGADDGEFLLSVAHPYC